MQQFLMIYEILTDCRVNSKLCFIDVLIVDFYEIWKLDFELMNSILIFNARGVNIEAFLD